jgi:hypothetical protein
MKLTINQGVVGYLKSEGFYPDTMFACLVAMKALAENFVQILDDMDDFSKSKRMMIIYLELIRKGFLTEDEEGPLLYQITEKGRVFLERIRALEEGTKEGDVEGWFDMWMELWPSGVKSGGKLIKSDKKSCLIKMKKFVKDYPEYSREIIFKATWAYLEAQAAKDYAFTKCAVYWIHKQNEGSDLAAYCQDIVEGKAASANSSSTSDQFFV